MRTLKISTLFFIAVLSFTACKKDKAPEKTTQEKILGKWNYISTVTETTRPPNPTKTTTSLGKTGDYLDFRADGKFYYVMNGSKEDSESYRIKSDTEIILDDRVCTITELNDSRFTFSNTTNGDGSASKITFNLSK